MSRAWPGWEDVPGIEIAPWAAFARDHGRNANLLAPAGPQGAHNVLYPFRIAISAEGDVTLPGNDDAWSAVVADGVLTGVRPMAAPDEVHTFVRAPRMAVPAGDIPPMLLTAYMPEDIVAMDPNTDFGQAIDCSFNPDGTRSGSMALMMCDTRGVSICSWPLTGESAASLLALMRDRHGEPMIEWVGDPADTEAMGDAFLDSGLGVLNVAHDCDEHGGDAR